MSRPYPKKAYVGDIHVPDESIPLPQTYWELRNWDLPADKYEIFDGEQWVLASELRKRVIKVQQ